MGVLAQDSANPDRETPLALTQQQRDAVVQRSLVWIAAAALPTFFMLGRKASAVCSADYRFAALRTPRPYSVWWIVAWLVLFAAAASVLAWFESSLAWFETDWETRTRPPS